MKLLQVVARIPSPPVDGGAIYVHYITECLLLDGHNVSIVGFHSNKHPQDTSMLRGAKWHIRDGRFRRYHPWAFIGSELSKLPVTVSHRMNRAIFRDALQEVTDRPDVILLEGVFVAHFIDDLRNAFPGVPIVLRSSNVEYDVLESNARVAPWYYAWVYKRQASLMKDFEHKVMQKVDGLTAITEPDRAVLSSMNASVPSCVITGGTSFPDPPADGSANPNLIGCIANWAWQPNRDGLDWFVSKVWPLIRTMNPEAGMEVAGGNMSPSQQSQLKAAGIRYLGFVDDANRFRQSLSMVVIPLISGGGMKLKTIETMGCGVPFVSTSTGVEGIEVENGTHALISDNPQQFAEYTHKVLTDPSLREKMASNALELATELYNWKGVTRKLTRFLEYEILAPRIQTGELA